MLRVYILDKRSRSEDDTAHTRLSWHSNTRKDVAMVKKSNVLNLGVCSIYEKFTQGAHNSLSMSMKASFFVRFLPLTFRVTKACLSPPPPPVVGVGFGFQCGLANRWVEEGLIAKVSCSLTFFK